MDSKKSTHDPGTKVPQKGQCSWGCLKAWNQPNQATFGWMVVDHNDKTKLFHPRKVHDEGHHDDPAALRGMIQPNAIIESGLGPAPCTVFNCCSNISSHFTSLESRSWKIDFCSFSINSGRVIKRAPLQTFLLACLLLHLMGLCMHANTINNFIGSDTINEDFWDKGLGAPLQTFLLACCCISSWPVHAITITSLALTTLE